MDLWDIWDRATDAIGAGIKSTIRDEILERVVRVIKLFVILSAAFTLVGVIGFKVTTGSAKGGLEALVIGNDTLALAGILDKIMLFSGFIRAGAFLMLLFAFLVFVINCIASLSPWGAVLGLIVTITSFVLSFQLSVYCSMSALVKTGVTELITPNAVQGMVPVNVILGLAIAEFLLAFIGMFKIE